MSIEGRTFSPAGRTIAMRARKRPTRCLEDERKAVILPRKQVERPTLPLVKPSPRGPHSGSSNRSRARASAPQIDRRWLDADRCPCIDPAARRGGVLVRAQNEVFVWLRALRGGDRQNRVEIAIVPDVGATQRSIWAVRGRDRPPSLKLSRRRQSDSETSVSPVGRIDQSSPTATTS